jgi:acyl-CoA dehydrogenase
VPFDGFGLPDDLWMLPGVGGDFVRGEIQPVEEELPADAREIPRGRLEPLQAKAREAGLW